MWKILRFRYRKFLDRILKRKKEKGGRLPASPPAWAGSQAGPFGRHPGLTPAWAGSPTGRLGRSPGLAAGLGRLPGRPTRVHAGLPCSLLCPSACLPAWAGSQAGPCGWCSGLPAGLGRLLGRAAFPCFGCAQNNPTAPFLDPLFKGLLPQK